MVACHIVAGMADFLLEVVVPDLPAYERLLLETLLELPGVTDVRSNVAIRTVKEADRCLSRPSESAHVAERGTAARVRQALRALSHRG